MRETAGDFCTHWSDTDIDTVHHPVLLSSHCICGSMSMSLKSPLTKFIGVDRSPHRIRPARVPFREPERRATSASLGVENTSNVSICMHLNWLGVVCRSVNVDSWSLSWIKRRARSAVNVLPTFSLSGWYSSLECKTFYLPYNSSTNLCSFSACLQ